MTVIKRLLTRRRPDGLYWWTKLDGTDIQFHTDEIAMTERRIGQDGGTYIYPRPYHPDMFIAVRESLEMLFSHPVFANGQRKR